MNTAAASPCACILTIVSALAITGDVRAGDASDDPNHVDEPNQDAHRRDTSDSDAARAGFQAGVRVAYTDGVGLVYKGVHLSEASAGALPLLVDVGWRIVPELYVGVYGQYAPVFLKTYALTCPSGSSCKAQDWRFGVEADYHFIPRFKLDPYVGLGAGFEVLHTSLRGTTLVQQGNDFVLATIVESITDRGWEFVSLTAGVDWRFCPDLGAGVFVLGTVGEYNVQRATGTATSGTQQEALSFAPIQLAPHALAFIGIRGTFNL